MMTYVTADKIIALIAALNSFIFLRKSDGLHLRLFPYYLLLEAAVETIGQYYYLHDRNNHPYYNLFTVINLSYFIYLFMKESSHEKTQRILLFALIIFPLIELVNIFFIQGVMVFNTDNLRINAVMIIILGFIYFYHLFKNQISVLRTPGFWIVLGVIFFYVSSITVLGLVNSLQSMSANTRSMVYSIVRFINIFAYTLYIIAFLCRLDLRKSLRNS